MRYFAEIAYDGSKYSGWQAQPNAPTIQEEVESVLTTLFQHNTPIVGCGRTDAGVHANSSFFHFDSETNPIELLHRMNFMLPKDISILRIIEVSQNAHARFDATLRSYIYHIHTVKNPFLRNYSYYYPAFSQFSLDRLNEVSTLLLDYTEFFPFCKTKTDVKTVKCLIKNAYWEHNLHDRFEFHISADRFLRGMVRLIVGACINVLEGKLNLHDLTDAMNKQERLDKNLSVPACGLFLTKVEYPYFKIDS